MSHKVIFDKQKLMRKVDKISEAALEAVGQQALKNMADSVPYDSGELYRSGIMKSQVDSLTLTWDTPYAKRMYYGVNLNFSKDHSSRAQAMWAHKDWDIHKGQYTGIIEKMKQRGL